MRVLVCVKATKESEAGMLPDTKTFAEMMKFNEQLVDAGVMLAAEGLRPTSKAKRVTFSGSKPTVTDGPFAETKELIAGFWLWRVKSMDEATKWLGRSPFGGGTQVDIRPLYEPEDLAEVLTSELREQDQRLRERAAKLK